MWQDRLSESVQELRNELLREQLPAYRTVDGEDYPWQSSPASTDASLGRFVTARKGDLKAAKKQFMENLAWRKRIFPIPRQGMVAQLLDEEVRFRNLPRDTDGCPVLLVNFLFGEFETKEITQATGGHGAIYRCIVGGAFKLG